VLVFAGGGDDEPEGTTVAETTPTTTTPDDTGDGPQGSDEPDREPSGKDQGGNGAGDEPALPADQEPPPETPYGPPGEPVGTVPPGAGPSEDQAAVVRTLNEFLAAIARGDGPQACAQLSQEGRARVEKELREAAPETAGTPCEGAIVLYQGGYGNTIKNPRYKNLRVSGTQATAVGPPNEDAALSKYGRTWLIDNYGW
jgi:hypothetical protein